MNKVLLIVLLLIAVGFIAPLSFAAEISGTVERVMKIESKKLVNPNPTLTPEENCDNCSESQKINTDIKSSPTPAPTVSPSPSPSGAEVKGVENTPVPTLEAISKPSIRPVVIPTISPSPLSSPSASISASPSAQPTLEPAEEKQTSANLKIWNWILNSFKIYL